MVWVWTLRHERHSQCGDTGIVPQTFPMHGIDWKCSISSTYWCVLKSQKVTTHNTSPLIGLKILVTRRVTTTDKHGYIIIDENQNTMSSNALFGSLEISVFGGNSQMRSSRHHRTTQQTVITDKDKESTYTWHCTRSRWETGLHWHY